SSNGIAVDRTDNMVLTGSFGGSVDFGGGALTSTGSADVFLVKYTTAGAYVWAKDFGTPLSASGNGVAVDGSGNVAVTGTFMGTANFGTGPLTSVGGNDIFIAEYSSAGDPLWSRRAGDTTTYDSGNGVAIDSAGNVVAIGYFLGTANFG